VFLALFAAFGRIDQEGNERMFGRKIPSSLVARAHRFLIRAVLLLLAAFFALTLTEILVANNDFTFRELAFETFSAFGTVGLSMGITDQLSDLGKLIIIVTMFAGRVSLISLAIPPRGKNWQALVDYPKGEVLIG
jgi:trk system potassium uptake protein TrkH